VSVIAPPTDSGPKLPNAPRQLLIGGGFVDAIGGETLASRDPATGEVLAEVAAAQSIDVDRAVKVARAAFEGPWASFSPAARAKVLWRLGDLIDEHAEELALIESLDTGKPYGLALYGDIAGAAEVMRYYAGWATKLYGTTATPSGEGAWHAYTLRQPVGVVGAIVPWNYPVASASWKIAPALATGCTVILKPAEQTPLSTLRLGELALEAGVPAGVLNILNGLGAIAGAAMAAHPGIDKIAFTGSGATGRKIVEAALGNLKKVSLELGGKSPNIVFADADIDAAIAGSSMGIFLNQGEVCIAASRLYVEASVFDRVVEGVAQRARDIKVGPGTAPDVEMGPVVSESHMARVLGYIESGVSDGAQVAAGGNRLGDKGYFVAPTVLVEPPKASAVMQEEIFGPVVMVKAFTDPDEVVREANDTRYGLAAGIWTSDVSRAHRVAAALQAGTVFVNTYLMADVSMPFGGVKESGWGRECGPESLDLYTSTKSVVIQL
jgi:phenylacetaldehyde dehydrogenase